MPRWTCGVRHRLAGALLAVWAIGVAGAQEAAPACGADERCEAIRTFFRGHGSYLSALAPEFLKAADANGLDWRLLPAISFVETRGRHPGKKANIFGWNSGRTRFASVEAGIHFVAGRLAKSPIYAGRTAMGILHKYNPVRSTYPPRVAAVMMEMAPHPVL